MNLPKPMIQLIGGLYLASLLFGLATWVMTPFMLYEVYDTNTNGKTINVKITSSYIYYRGNKSHLKISFITPEGENITIGDALPGDISTRGNNSEIAGQFHNGKSYSFIQVGNKYYVGHGEYWWSLVIALIGFIPYTYLIYSIRMGKNKNRKHNSINT
jgi:hypothetical protein